MRILSAQVSNFGSYKELEFSFDNQGLALIYGSTGAGKSTLMDVVPWCLFGVTAKNGNADDVRSWGTETCTQVTLLVEVLPGTCVRVTRIRGSSKENDLYFYQQYLPELTRGKDLNDTQKLLNDVLGIDAETFLASAYFHEFSEAGSFFTAKASERRAVLEGIADLTLPVRINETAQEARKALKPKMDKVQEAVTRYSGRVQQVTLGLAETTESIGRWQAEQDKRVAALLGRNESFETDRVAGIQSLLGQIERCRSNRIQDHGDLEYLDNEWRAKQVQIDSICEACGSPKRNAALEEYETKRALILKDAATRSKYNQSLEINAAKLEQSLRNFENSENPFPDQIEAETEKVNPFSNTLHTQKQEHRELSDKAMEAEDYLKTLSGRANDYTRLQELSAELRGELLKKAVRETQESVNRCLETYFDAELRVMFELKGADKLDIAITKNGHDCVYKMLSKGQRQLLKIAFVTTIMAATANRAGYHPNVLMFDEVLSGLDADLKMKAFDLFSSLATKHESVILIDHDTELQQAFSKRYKAELAGDISSLTEEV